MERASWCKADGHKFQTRKCQASPRTSRIQYIGFCLYFSNLLDRHASHDSTLAGRCLVDGFRQGCNPFQVFHSLPEACVVSAGCRVKNLGGGVLED